MKAVVDRIVDGKWAVLLAESNGKEYNLPVENLPPYVKEGSIVSIILENNVVSTVKLLEDETLNEQNRINEKMNKLQSRKKSNFKQK